MAKIILKRNNMKKIFISIFLISFVFNFANAEEVKKNKTDAEWIKEFQDLEKREKEANKKIENAKLEMSKSQKELEKAQKLGKTLDEINNLVGVDKK